MRNSEDSSEILISVGKWKVGDAGALKSWAYCLEVKFLRTCNAKLEAFQRLVKILNREPGSGGARL